MIRSEPDPESPSGSRLANSGEFSHKGIEAALTVRATDDLALSVTSTNLDLQDDTALSPHNIYTFGAAFTPSQFTFELNGRAVTEPYNQDNKQDKLNNFFVLDFQGGYRLNKIASLFVAVENAFDEEYEIVKGFPRPGRSVFGGISLSGK